MHRTVLFIFKYWRNEGSSLIKLIFSGISCGLLYFPSLSIVAQWFESRRALAVGLAICGSGIGICGMALGIEHAVRIFTWRGVLIIFGAVFFQLSVGPDPNMWKIAN